MLYFVEWIRVFNNSLFDYASILLNDHFVVLHNILISIIPLRLCKYLCFRGQHTYPVIPAVTLFGGIISLEARRRRFSCASICFQVFHALAIGALAIWNDSTTKWNSDTSRLGTSRLCGGRYCPLGLRSRG